MPKNRLLYIGLLIVAASALIWVGAWLTSKIVFIVPYAIGAGAIMIVIGLVMESRKRQEAETVTVTTSPGAPAVPMEPPAP